MISERFLIETDPYETRVARLEDRRLVEFWLERPHQQSLVGNIYKGRVSRVVPGMGAAFIDVGLERDAFLYVADVLTPPLADEDSDSADEETEALPPNSEVVPERPRIEDLLQVGQELLVQVKKDPLSSKGARVTSHLALAGRYLVRLPTMSHCGVSRRIQPETERERLRAIANEVLPAGEGWIVRTAAHGASVAQLERDRDLLQKRWKHLEEQAALSGAPRLLETELDLVGRVIRDHVPAQGAELLVADRPTWERLLQELPTQAPELLEQLHLESGFPPLFDRFAIEKQLDEALNPRVSLPSGGSIVIHTTEALVAIDVNSGRFTGERNLEATALATNLEAIEEIVRQIRLRDLGGILVLDLIDMEKEENRRLVFERLRQLLERDRSRPRLLTISEFGLVQMTRKRSRPNLEQLLTEVCSCCEGRRRVLSIKTICLRLRRRILAQASSLPKQHLVLDVAPEVAHALEGNERSILAELEERLGAKLILRSNPLKSRSEFEVVPA